MRPTIFDLLSKRAFPRKHLFAALLNVPSCLFLACAVCLETDETSMSFPFKRGLGPSDWALQDRVITLSMSVLIYALHGFDGVMYCKFNSYGTLICSHFY